MRIDKQQFAKNLGHTIAKYRQKMNLTQEQLSEKIGIGNEAVSRIERGIVLPSLMRLIEFAEVFDCSIADLLVKSGSREQDDLAYLIGLFNEIKETERYIVIKTMECLIHNLKNK